MRLDSLLSALMQGSHAAILEHIEAAHRALAEQLGITPNAQFEEFLEGTSHGSADIAGGNAAVSTMPRAA